MKKQFKLKHPTDRDIDYFQQKIEFINKHYPGIKNFFVRREKTKIIRDQLKILKFYRLEIKERDYNA